jgi:hypothetical protein
VFFSSTLFPSVSVFSFYFSWCCCRLREWWQLEVVMMTERRWLFPTVAGSVLLLFFPSVPWRKFLPFPSMVFFPLTAVLLLLAALMVVEWRRFQGVRHVSSSPPCRDPSLCFFLLGLLLFALLHYFCHFASLLLLPSGGSKRKVGGALLF